MRARRPPPTGSTSSARIRTTSAATASSKDLKWVTKTPYGDLDITINLSKPEKDPKAIAAAKLAKPSAPIPSACSAWRTRATRAVMNHPARENHRIIPLTINGECVVFAVFPLCLLQ